MNLWSNEIAVLVDMAGCPNRCRHCWLGCPPNKELSIELFHCIVQQFKEWSNSRQDKSIISAMTWYREPDFALNYKELYELEREINGGKTERFELLSIWRLARDADYAGWAYEVGTKICQITFFGMEKTHDYFVRRHGSFSDSILATGRLLEAGIIPRWQIFLTKSILPEIADLLKVAEHIELEKRIKDIGGEFDIFINTPSPDGEAWNIEYLRPDAHCIDKIPDYLLEKTIKYFSAKSPNEAIGYAESDLILQLLNDDKPYGSKPDKLAFMVTSDLNVFSNIGEMTDWWLLGNLKSNGIDRIMQRFEDDEPLGMKANFHIAIQELAEKYGVKNSRKIYSLGDLKTRLIRQWAQNEWNDLQGKHIGLPRHN